MGLKKYLVNFGVDLVVKNGFQQLEKHKKDVITFFEDAFLKYISAVNLEMLIRLGATEEQAQFLKDKGFLFVRGFIAVLVNIVLMQAQGITKKLVGKIKL